VSSDALLLFLIIFAWTPPHFWALALYREKESRQRRHPDAAGDARRRIHPAAYPAVYDRARGGDLMPFATHMSGGLYLAGRSCSMRFLMYAWRLYRRYSDTLARKTFRYSIQYLAFLFALLLIDHYRFFIQEGRCSSFCISRVKNSVTS